MIIVVDRARHDHNFATNPGPNTRNCPVSASFLGFDQNSEGPSVANRSLLLSATEVAAVSDFVVC